MEGMERSFLRKLLAPFEHTEAYQRASDHPLTKAELYADGLCGGSESVAARDRLAESLGLPCGMSANALLAALKLLVSFEEYCSLVGRDASERADRV